jgi:hypothetical protein
MVVREAIEPAQPPNILQSCTVAADDVEATLPCCRAPGSSRASPPPFWDKARWTQLSKASVVPPVLYLWPYSHLPLTGSQWPPIAIAHFDCTFLQPLSANAAVDDTKIESAAIAAAAFVEPQSIETRLSEKRRRAKCNLR